MGGWFSGKREEQAQQSISYGTPEQTATLQATVDSIRKKKKAPATQTKYGGGTLGSSEIADINRKTLLGE